MSKNNIQIFKELLLEKGDDALFNAKYLNMSAYDVLETYDILDLQQPIKIVKNTWHNRGGWGNGYVKIAPNHKYFNADYEEINVLVHGGVTFIGEVDFSKGRWIGFDTIHYGDNLTNWSMQAVLSETIDLFRQIYHLK